MGHCRVEAAEAILDKQFPVLDNGFVRLVDYLGGDARIVQAARVSYGAGTRTVREDRRLIDYLLRNDHTSPFEQVVLTFHTKMPIFVARQWVRHRTARINEVSGRYSVMKEEFYVPEPEDVAFQSGDNKQGRAEEPAPREVADRLRQVFEEEQRRSYRSYQELLEMGIARELARANLPISLYTEWYWQMDLHNLFHFLRLRLDPHAQREIRAYAQVIYGITASVCPLACEAFEEHVNGGVRFSAHELAALREVVAGRENPLTGRSLERFEHKLNRGSE